MTLSFADRMINRWAARRSYRCTSYRIGDGPVHLRVFLRHATADFADARLTQLVLHERDQCLDALVTELASLFALCGVLDTHRSHRAGGLQIAGEGVKTAGDDAKAAYDHGTESMTSADPHPHQSWTVLSPASSVGG